MPLTLPAAGPNIQTVGGIGGGKMAALRKVFTIFFCFATGAAGHAADSNSVASEPAKGFDISISRTEPDGQYLVDVQFKKAGKDGTTSETVAMPKVLVVPGKSAKIEMGGHARDNSREPDYMIEVVTPPDLARHPIRTVAPDRSMNYPMQIKVYQTPRK